MRHSIRQRIGRRHEQALQEHAPDHDPPAGLGGAAQEAGIDKPPVERVDRRLDDRDRRLAERGLELVRGVRGHPGRAASPKSTHAPGRRRRARSGSVVQQHRIRHPAEPPAARLDGVGHSSPVGCRPRRSSSGRPPANHLCAHPATRRSRPRSTRRPARVDKPDSLAAAVSSITRASFSEGCPAVLTAP